MDQNFFPFVLKLAEKKEFVEELPHATEFKISNLGRDLPVKIHFDIWGINVPDGKVKSQVEHEFTKIGETFVCTLKSEFKASKLLIATVNKDFNGILEFTSTYNKQEEHSTWMWVILLIIFILFVLFFARH